MEAIDHPGQLGFDPDRLQQIEIWMKRYVEEKKYAGSSLLIGRQGKIAYLQAVGRRSIEDDLPFEIDNLVRIYSMTKPLTSLAVMMLHEKGLFHLEATIDRFLPEFANCHALIEGAQSVAQTFRVNPPTIHQLLTHTSGLIYGFNPGVLAGIYEDEGINFRPTAGGHHEMAKRVAKLPLAFQPGKRWEYSIGIDILGVLVEIVSGKGLDQFLHEEIIGPLGMVDTSFRVSNSALGRLANCYEKTADDNLALRDDAKNSCYHEDVVDTYSGGGGLVSTLSDYFKFAEMWRCGGSLNGVRLVAPGTISFMCQNHLVGDIASMGTKTFSEMPMDGMGFGLGGSVVLDPVHTRMMGSIGDFSWGGRASTYFWIDPVKQLSVVFFTQLVPSSSYPCRAELKALVHGALIE